MFISSIKTRSGEFHVFIMQETAKKCTISHCIVAAGVKSRSSPCTITYFNKIVSEHVRKLPLRGRWQAEGGEKISDLQVLLSLSVEGDRAPAPLFFLALYRFQNVMHFIYCTISSYFSRLPPLRTRTPQRRRLQSWTESPPQLIPPPQIKDEAAQKPKRAISPSLIWV